MTVPFGLGGNLFRQEGWKRRGEEDPTLSSAIDASLPVGVPVPWPSATAPTNWVICDGGAVPAGCPQLTALYGANLPNLKGKVIVGYDPGDASFNTLLGTGGSKDAIAVSHNHTQDSHNHTQNGHNHTQDAHNHTQDPHLHGFLGDTGSRWVGTGITPNGETNTGVTQSFTVAAMDTATATNQSQTATNQSQTATNQAQTATNQSAGSSGTGANLVPYRVFNYIVRQG